MKSLIKNDEVNEYGSGPVPRGMLSRMIVQYHRPDISSGLTSLFPHFLPATPSPRLRTGKPPSRFTPQDSRTGIHKTKKPLVYTKGFLK